MNATLLTVELIELFGRDLQILCGSSELWRSLREKDASLPSLLRVYFFLQRERDTFLLLGCACAWPTILPLLLLQIFSLLDLRGCAPKTMSSIFLLLQQKLGLNGAGRFRLRIDRPHPCLLSSSSLFPFLQLLPPSLLLFLVLFSLGRQPSPSRFLTSPRQQKNFLGSFSPTALQQTSPSFLPINNERKASFLSFFYEFTPFHPQRTHISPI